MSNPLLKPTRQTCFGSTSTRLFTDYLKKQGSLVRVVGLESVFPETTTVVPAPEIPMNPNETATPIQTMDPDEAFRKEFTSPCGHTLSTPNEDLLGDVRAFLGEEAADLLTKLLALQLERHANRRCLPVDLELKMLLAPLVRSGKTTSLKGLELEEMPCGHKVHRELSPTVMEDLLAFHGKEALDSAKEALANEREIHARKMCAFAVPGCTITALKDKDGFLEFFLMKDGAMVRNLQTGMWAPPSGTVLPEPRTTDYCRKCGESPDSGTHLMGSNYHPYEDPRPSQGALFSKPPPPGAPSTVRLVDIEHFPCGHQLRRNLDPEILEDLKAFHGIDAEEELTAAIEVERLRHFHKLCGVNEPECRIESKEQDGTRRFYLMKGTEVLKELQAVPTVV